MNNAETFTLKTPNKDTLVVSVTEHHVGAAVAAHVEANSVWGCTPSGLIAMYDHKGERVHGYGWALTERQLKKL